MFIYMLLKSRYHSSTRLPYCMLSKSTSLLFAPSLFRYSRHQLTSSSSRRPHAFPNTCPQVNVNIIINVNTNQPVNTSTCPKQKFDRIRARWETTQPTVDRPSSSPMAGRKEKPATHLSLNTDTNNGGGSKFRRKLSQGLSFISNPLSQRKTTPGRLPPGRQPLASATPAVPFNGNISTASDALLSPVCAPKPFDHPHHTSAPYTTSKDDATIAKDSHPIASPKPLPRSRTMSYIPRPSRTTSASSTTESETTPKPRLPRSTFASQHGSSPSKIPSPPATKRRISSPRPYLLQHTTQQSKDIAAGMAFTPNPIRGQSSPSKASVRSYTTSNLIKGKAAPQQPSFIMPRQSQLQHRPVASPRVQRPSIKENHIQTGERDNGKCLQVQDMSSRRGSLVVPAVVLRRSSLGLSGSSRQSKQATHTTPTGVKRLSTNSATQAPLKARQLQPNKQQSIQSTTAYRYSNGGSIAQPRLMGLVNPPLPQVVDHVATQPPSTERDLRRRAVSRTPSQGKGKVVGMTSKAVVGGNIEVRQRIPRSHTFHTLWSHCDPPPPVPPIPAMYKSFSQPLLVVQEPAKKEDNEPLFLMSEEKSSDHGSNFGSKDSVSGNLMGASSPFVIDLNDADLDKRPKFECEPNLQLGPCVTLATPSKSGRPWSIHDQHIERPDTDGQVQVKTYMPPLWWAGRFQSRFDQWRTEAMMAELDPKYKPEGLPGTYSLSQEKVAACYVFLQLRDLCISNSAADSLWDFEYKYRKDHKLIGDEINTSVSPKRRLDDTTTRVSFGRAVRKITPRKSSLVNLLKGKGWNKVEGIAQTNMPSRSSSDS